MKSDYVNFLKELPASFQQIGAMLPSSRFLGHEMVRAVRAATGPIRILEVGPGTGPFTRQILRLMGPEDRLVVCEINERFLSLLKERLSRNKDFLANQDRVEFFLGPVQSLPGTLPGQQFDVIVSSVPFTNFAPELVAEIAESLEALLAPGGSITMLEYLGLRQLSLPFSTQERRRRLLGVERVIQQWRNRVKIGGKISTKVSFLNVPPALSIQFSYESHSERTGNEKTAERR